jgi:hypothetical protein
MKKLILTVMLLGGLIAADDVNITASIVESSDQIVLEVRVSGSATPALKVPQINDFEVTNGGQSRQSNFSIINGQMSSTATVVHTFILTPKGPGKFTIPSFTAEHKGKIYKSQPLQVEVVSGGTAQQKKGRAPAGTVTTPANTGNENLYVQVTVNKNKVYVNEPVVQTFGFYRRINLMGQPQYIPADSTGFWKEELTPQLTYQSNGYEVTELKTALFPSSPGEYTIGKATLNCSVSDRGSSDDFFGSFFGRGRNVRLESKPVNITVMPLPSEGKPQDFSGTVGRFTLSASVDKRDVKTNDAVNLTVTITGLGNIKTITEPKLYISDEFKKYETVTDTKISKENYEVRGSKIFKTVLVPRKAGKLTVPGVSYSYFDYIEKQYKTLASAPIQLNVAQGPKEETGNYASLPSLPAAEGVKVFGSDIRHIKQSDNFTYAKRPFYKSLLYIILNLLPLMTWLFILFYLRVQKSKEANAAYFKSSRAYGAALKNIKILGKSLQKGKEGETLGKLEQVFAEFIGHKISRQGAGLSVEDIKCVLAEKVKEQKLIDAAVELVEKIHFLRFGPSGKNTADLVRLVEEVKELISKLEKAGL